MAKNTNKGKIVACLDMGSSKLICTIAAIHNDEVEILGYGHKESRGIVGSAISDMRLAQKSITNAVSEAEMMAKLNIDRLLIGISGSQVISSRKEFSVKINSGVVKTSDINSLAAKVRAEFKKNHHEIIHLVPLQYRIDDSAAVVNPRYMSGETLYARFHIVSTSQTTIKNIENCLKRCQLSVNNYVVEPYVSGLSCLTDNEINLGSLIIDIGGNSTSFAIISEGKLIQVGSCQVGGVHITKDISTILNIDFESAEKIKNINGSLLISPIEEREMIKLKITDANEMQSIVQITRIELRDIIQSRLEEIFEEVRLSLEKSRVNLFMLSNIVLTGGCSSIIGIDKLATEIFEKSVRIGYPNNLDLNVSEINNPTHACSIGMLVFLKNLHQKEKIKDGFESRSNWMTKLIEKIAAI